LAAKRKIRIPDHIREKLTLPVAPDRWLSKARQLRKSSNLLFVQYEQENFDFGEKFERDPSISDGFPDDSVVVLLLGFAVENLLKGLFVTATGMQTGNVKGLKELKIPGEPHELEPVAEAVSKFLNLEFSEVEKGLLQALEHYIRWWGRYPSATHIDNAIPMHEDGKFKKFMLRYPDDHFAIVALYDRLEKRLAALAGANPSKPTDRL
jgi:hypothetical protein